jgi:hypothetical protein
MPISRTLTPQLITPKPGVFDELVRMGNAAAGQTASRAGSTAPTVTNAQTVQGYAAASLLDRANHTGPRYEHWWLRNENAGMVVRGTARGGLYRLTVDDGPDGVAWLVEAAGTLVAGDVLFDAGAGPVLRGIYHGNAYRLRVDDTEAGAPMLDLVLTPEAAIYTTDLTFAHGGVTFLNRGRQTAKWWAWRADDSQGADGLNEAILIEELVA